MGKIASRGLSGDSERRLAFKVELARGASHIASTLTPSSTTAAVAEVLDQFIVDRGAGGFDAFRLLLLQKTSKTEDVCRALKWSSYIRAGDRRRINYTAARVI